MPPIILVLLQGLFLLLLYVFIARAVRAVLRDIAVSSAAPRPIGRPKPRAARPAAPAPAERRPRTPPRELVVHLPDGKPKVVPLRAEEIRIGRATGCDIRLDDSYVSDLHARVYRNGEQWMVADMGSTNGTFLNQSKVASPAPLSPGDQLAVGKTVVEVRR